MNENEWIKKVKAYHAKHPAMTYKECLIKLSKKNQKGKGEMRTWEMKPEDYAKERTRSPLPIRTPQGAKAPGLVAGAPLPFNLGAKAQNGGNPALLALAQSSGQMSTALDGIIGNITDAVNKQQERAFEKNKLTGWYDMRKRFKNERVIESKSIELFNRYRELRDKGKFPNWSDEKIWEFATQNS